MKTDKVFTALMLIIGFPLTYLTVVVTLIKYVGGVTPLKLTAGITLALLIETVFIVIVSRVIKTH